VRGSASRRPWGYAGPVHPTDGAPGTLAWAEVQACTLPSADRPLRVADFDALFAAHLRRVERPTATRARLVMAPGDGVAARVRRLADAESSCCSFFDFRVTEHADRVDLDVRVPAAYADVLAGLVSRAASALGE
jgi:hypothetical protein